MKDTGAKCPICANPVMGEVKAVPRYSLYHMPMGPINEANYELVVSFWCSNPQCAISFLLPPGQPDAKARLLAEERERIAEVQRRW